VRGDDEPSSFESGLDTRKSRNLACDPRCVLTVSTHRYDVAVEGSARIMTDRARLERIAQVYADRGERLSSA
jgi:hypothetical protein